MNDRKAELPAAGDWDALLEEVCAFPLFSALFGRRSRRFGWGMEIPRGPLAFKSRRLPAPLDDFERSLLVAAGLGVSEWHFGIPFSTTEQGLCSYSARYTGRTAPSAAGIGNAELIYTQDDGTYFVSTRDAGGDGNWGTQALGSAAHLIATVGRRTRKLSSERVSLPRHGPHLSEHNTWNANVAGSTLFVPIANVSEQLLGFMFVILGAGYTIWDDFNGRPLGPVGRFLESGLLDRDKKYPYSYLEQYILTTCGVEIGIICQHIVLALQAIGLGGWLFTGISPFSLLGAMAASGIKGLGFRFATDPRWGVPNPLGLDGVYEAYCPPYHRDMRAAVDAFVALKYGSGGTYDPQTPGPFRDTPAMKSQAARPSAELIECVATVAEHIYSTYGKFPGTVPSIFARFYAQAQRLESEFYDRFFADGSYLETHARNIARWSVRGGNQ
jgi:hypothetical protein